MDKNIQRFEITTNYNNRKDESWSHSIPKRPIAARKPGIHLTDFQHPWRRIRAHGVSRPFWPAMGK